MDAVRFAAVEVAASATRTTSRNTRQPIAFIARVGLPVGTVARAADYQRHRGSSDARHTCHFAGGIGPIAAMGITRFERAKMTAKRDLARTHAALRGGLESEGSSPGNGRSAGPEAMADPESAWDVVAETSDESFPCSDPPAWSPTQAGSSERRS
ncbi:MULTISPECIES: hypothetical protein [Rhodopseudomonas]|uniref:hypothetical protein n=1 Tax=Rhodopseudomonas TaxID=1073 RepID=UPI001FCE679D|nr:MULTISPECIES: hypothetical protein [Rhodopseudomonas]